MCDFGTRATSSGVPAATTRPPSLAALGAEVDHVVGRLDDVEVVLDHDDRVALVDEPCRARRAASACPRSAGRSSARRGCRASGRCPAATAPWPASRAAPRRRTASSPTARARCSRAPRPAGSAACWRSAGSSRAARSAWSTVRSSTSAIDLPRYSDLERLAVVAAPLALLAGHVHVRAGSASRWR